MLLREAVAVPGTLFQLQEVQALLATDQSGQLLDIKERAQYQRVNEAGQASPEGLKAGRSLGFHLELDEKVDKLLAILGTHIDF